MVIDNNNSNNNNNNNNNMVTLFFSNLSNVQKVMFRNNGQRQTSSLTADCCRPITNNYCYHAIALLIALLLALPYCSSDKCNNILWTRCPTRFWSFQTRSHGHTLGAVIFFSGDMGQKNKLGSIGVRANFSRGLSHFCPKNISTVPKNCYDNLQNYFARLTHTQ